MMALHVQVCTDQQENGSAAQLIATESESEVTDKTQHQKPIGTGCVPNNCTIYCVYTI